MESDYAVGYDEAEKPLGHERRENPRAAGSMDTTLSDYAKFILGIMQNKELKAEYKNEMVKSQIRIFSKAQFPTPPRETTAENRGIKLGYGLGWGVFQTPYGDAYFKEGRDDGWENHSACFPEKKIAVILMSDSSNGDNNLQGNCWKNRSKILTRLGSGRTTFRMTVSIDRTSTFRVESAHSEIREI